MFNLSKWLFDKDRRELLKFGGGALVVVIGASWTAFKYFEDKGEMPQKIEATYNVCQGQYRENCPPNTVHLTCEKSVSDWAAHECASYQTNVVSIGPGNHCGYSVIQIKCTVGK